MSDLIYLAKAASSNQHIAPLLALCNAAKSKEEMTVVIQAYELEHYSSQMQYMTRRVLCEAIEGVARAVYPDYTGYVIDGSNGLSRFAKTIGEITNILPRIKTATIVEAIISKCAITDNSGTVWHIRQFVPESYCDRCIAREDV